MSTQWKRLFPSRFELGALGIIAVAVLFLGNSRSLLDYYGLESSTQVIQQGTQHVIGNGLSHLDDFSATNQVVTFAIWAFIGLICYSVVISIAQAMHRLHQERLVSSGRYVHPADFSRQAFWRQVSLSFGILLVTLLVLGAVVYGFFAVILPIGLKYGHELLFHSSLSSVGGFLVAVVIVYLWLVLIDICLRVLMQRHRFAA